MLSIKSKYHFNAWIEGRYLRCLLFLKIKINKDERGFNGHKWCASFFVSSYCVCFGIDVFVFVSCVLICKISLLTDTNILKRFVMLYSHI